MNGAQRGEPFPAIVRVLKMTVTVRHTVNGKNAPLVLCPPFLPFALAHKHFPTFQTKRHGGSSFERTPSLWTDPIQDQERGSSKGLSLGWRREQSTTRGLTSHFATSVTSATTSTGTRPTCGRGFEARDHSAQSWQRKLLQGDGRRSSTPPLLSCTFDPLDDLGSLATVSLDLSAWTKDMDQNLMGRSLPDRPRIPLIDSTFGAQGWLGLSCVLRSSQGEPRIGRSGTKAVRDLDNLLQSIGPSAPSPFFNDTRFSRTVRVLPTPQKTRFVAKDILNERKSTNADPLSSSLAVVTTPLLSCPEK